MEINNRMKHVGMSLDCWSILSAFYDMEMSLLSRLLWRQVPQAETAVVLFRAHGLHKENMGQQTLNKSLFY